MKRIRSFSRKAFYMNKRECSCLQGAVWGGVGVAEWSKPGAGKQRLAQGEEKAPRGALGRKCLSALRVRASQYFLIEIPKMSQLPRAEESGDSESSRPGPGMALFLWDSGD